MNTTIHVALNSQTVVSLLSINVLKKPFGKLS